MLFQFGQSLFNLNLRYQSRLGINLLKLNCKQGQFVKSGGLSYLKPSIVIGASLAILVNGFYILATAPIAKVEGMIILLFTFSLATSLVSLAPLIKDTDNFILLLNMLIGVDKRFGDSFSGISTLEERPSTCPSQILRALCIFGSAR